MNSFDANGGFNQQSFRDTGKVSEYIFHLDAQTIVLEDYLETYPEKREELSKWIKQGNILVGPWYLQNDFYLTSGEATVRNLIEGHRIAESFGACADAGYAPTSLETSLSYRRFLTISELITLFSAEDSNAIMGTKQAKSSPNSCRPSLYGRERTERRLWRYI